MNESSSFDCIWDQFALELNLNSNSGENISVLEQDNAINSLANYNCNCGNTNPVESSDSFSVCSNCGTALDIIFGDEKMYNMTGDDGVKGKNVERSGPAQDMLLPRSSMSTVIRGTSNLSRTQQWMDNADITYYERVLIKHKQKLNELTMAHNLPKDIIIDVLYSIKELIDLRDIKGNKIIHRGRVYTGLISVIFYYTCKRKNYNIPAGNIMQMFGIDTKTFGKCCSIYCEKLNKNVDNKVNADTSNITRCFGELNLGNALLILAKKLMNSANILYVTIGVNQKSNISGIIYFLSKKLDLDLDLDTIVSVTKSSVHTTKKIYLLYLANEKEIYNHIKYYS